ncbi:RNA polymerase sigma factor [Novipirellula aureliae]|nr:sigma-70 family RNA polymerase sigma factor [Novipirellula aureliae]
MSKPTPRVNPPAAEGASALALLAVFESEETRLLRYAFSLTGRREVAEEIVQDVFLLLHSHWDDVNDPAAWLMRTVRNKAFTHIRDNRREVFGCDDHKPPISYSDQKTPEEWLLRMEAQRVVRTLLSQLSDSDRQLLKLKYFEDRKYSEIAAQTGLSVGNVGYRLHHLLKDLAKKLSPLGIDGKS